jgi:hypothetical protein
VLVLCIVSAVPGTAKNRESTACAINEGSCTKMAGPVRVTLDILPKPLKTMSELQFSVSLTRNDKPIDAREVLVEMTMPGMYMGKNVVKLQRDGDRFTGTGVILRCMSGRKNWHALVRFNQDNKASFVDFDFEVI